MDIREYSLTNLRIGLKARIFSQGQSCRFHRDHYHKKFIFFLMGVLRNQNIFAILLSQIKSVGGFSATGLLRTGNLVVSNPSLFL